MILRAWRSELLWTATTTSIVTLACVPDKSFLLVLVALDYLFAGYPFKSGLSGPVSKWGGSIIFTIGSGSRIRSKHGFLVEEFFFVQSPAE